MKYNNLILIFSSLILLILLFIVPQKFIQHSESQQIKNPTYKIEKYNNRKNKTNIKTFQLDSNNWNTYHLEMGAGEIKITRYDDSNKSELGSYPIEMRWKKDNYKEWDTGLWYFKEKSPIYGIWNITIIEFKLPNDIEGSKTLEVSQTFE